MPRLIEFNLKAKPVMAQAFGGTLTEGLYYQLRCGHIITIVPINNKGGVAPNNWVRGKYVSGDSHLGMESWWMDTGLFQGAEFTPDHKFHVIKEIEKPVGISEVFMKANGVYVTKGGMMTTAMKLYQVHHLDVGGPVWSCRLIKPDGNLSLACMYNHQGLYVGGPGVQFPKGAKDSNRSIVAEATYDQIMFSAAAHMKPLTKMPVPEEDE